MIDFKNITVAGSGVLGYQIAFQAAFKGFNVTIYDISDEILEKAKTKFDYLATAYKSDLKATDKQISATKVNLKYNANLADAVKNADLVIEAIPENPQIKTEFYTNLGKVAPINTIFATNSSTLLPSQFADSTGRPSQFLALHFANEIWKHNTAEIMKHARTDENVFNSVIQFAKELGMVALPIYKEQPGYILNSLLVPFLGASLNLFVNKIADITTIDKTWMVATGAPMGPFAIFDIVGVETAYNITKMEADATKNPDKAKAAEFLKTEYLDKNKLGIATNEGFYKYPNPAFMDKDFLK